MRSPATDSVLPHGHAHVKADAVEPVGQRHHQAARQQQHVEQKGADRGHPQNRQHRSSGLPHETPPGERDRGHRRNRVNTSRRSDNQADATAAARPSGTAYATDR